MGSLSFGGHSILNFWDHKFFEVQIFSTIIVCEIFLRIINFWASFNFWGHSILGATHFLGLKIFGGSHFFWLNNCLRSKLCEDH